MCNGSHGSLRRLHAETAPTCTMDDLHCYPDEISTLLFPLGMRLGSLHESLAFKLALVAWVQKKAQSLFIEKSAKPALALMSQGCLH